MEEHVSIIEEEGDDRTHHDGSNHNLTIYDDRLVHYGVHAQHCGLG